MNDRYVEVTSRSWTGRLVDSIKGVLIGLVLLIGSLPVLWWNEGRAVRTARSLNEGQAQVVSVPADAVRPENEGKLVHVAAMASTQESLADNAFGVVAQALTLSRHVEMYQWVEEQKTETRKKTGGSEEKVTTYDYDRKWNDTLIISSQFKHPEGHSNPKAMAYSSLDIVARNATLGVFHLPEEILKKITQLEPYPLDARAATRLPGNLTGKAKVVDGALFMGADPASPQLGDLRVSYRVLPGQTISLVAKQAANSFVAYHAQAGDDVLLVQRGTKDAAAMFQSAQEANAMLTWILRVVGFLMMAVGLTLILRPIVIVADFIPMIGSLAGLSAAVFAVLVAFPVSALVIAVAWIAVRPLLGVAVMAVALLGFVVMVGVAVAAWRRRKRLRTA
jgi:hypothetical protein